MTKNHTFQKVILKRVNQRANICVPSLQKKGDGLGTGGNGELTKMSPNLSFLVLYVVNKKQQSSLKYKCNCWFSFTAGCYPQVLSFTVGWWEPVTTRSNLCAFKGALTGYTGQELGLIHCHKTPHTHFLSSSAEMLFGGGVFCKSKEAKEFLQWTQACWPQAF